jgi:hypothetical protein
MQRSETVRALVWVIKSLGLEKDIVKNDPCEKNETVKGLLLVVISLGLQEEINSILIKKMLDFRGTRVWNDVGK